MLRCWAIAAAVLLAASACARVSGDGDGRPLVAASFYPIAWVAEQVGGPDVRTVGLTKPGAEPHDLELTPREVARVVDSDLVLYVRGFQPSVDRAVGEARRGHVLDLAAAADLDLELGEGVDPHFWLDPARLAAVASAVGRRLAAIDPERAGAYTARAGALVARLDALDARFRDGLATCARTDLVTSHAAFGYLARRYGLTQVGLAGLAPEAEPSPGALARVAAFVEDHGVTTVFFESLVSPAVASAIAEEAGARTDVLDPLESLGDGSPGRDYLEVMESNLRNLRRALECR
jgi:zinc transport system substrate-binding protein